MLFPIDLLLAAGLGVVFPSLTNLGIKAIGCFLQDVLFAQQVKPFLIPFRLEHGEMGIDVLKLGPKLVTGFGRRGRRLGW